MSFFLILSVSHLFLLLVVIVCVGPYEELSQSVIGFRSPHWKFLACRNTRRLTGFSTSSATLESAVKGWWESWCDFHSANSSVHVCISLHVVRLLGDKAGKNRRNLLVVRKMGLHGIALLNTMHFKWLQVTDAEPGSAGRRLSAGRGQEQCKLCKDHSESWAARRCGRFSLLQTCRQHCWVEGKLSSASSGHGGRSSSWALLADEGGALMAARLPVLTAERLNLGGCRSMNCVSQEKLHNGPRTIKLWRFMPSCLGVCVQQLFLGEGRGHVSRGFLHPTVCTFSLFVRGNNACTKDNPPLLLNPSTKRYLLRLAFWRTKCFFNFALSASMSTVYGVRGIHITAASGPPYSLGLFGHWNNPFLGSFEKATQLCRLINCKSWPTRKYCVK